MPLLEFGLRTGLAANLQYDQRINDLRYNEEAQRRAENEAAAKAKMLADDMAFATPMNSFDNPMVKQQAQFQIKRIGSYINQNPDWQTNVQKRAQYGVMLRELKDNEHLNRGIAADTAMKDMDKYQSDPKNADIVNSNDWKAIQAGRDNYLKFGHQAGEEVAKKQGLKAFSFVPPEAAQDTATILMNLAKNVEHDKVSSYQDGGYKKQISQTRKLQAVEHAIASGNWGKYLKKDYNNYLDQLNDNEKTNAKTVNQFTLERMNPYFKQDEINIGFAPRLDAKGSKTPAEAKDMWSTMHVKALHQPGAEIDFNPAAMDKTFANDYGQMNLNNVKTPFGEPKDLGLMKANSTGIVTVDNIGGVPVANHKVMVRMPIENFYQLGDNYKDVIDEGGFGQILPGGPSNGSTNWSIHNEYKKDFSKYTDEKGRDFVEFPVSHHYDPRNINLADNYGNAHNISPHKEDPYISTDENQRVGKDEAGNLWILDANGNAVAPYKQ